MNEFQEKILIIIIVAFILFLIFREVLCWYWKINKRIELQKKQIAILEEILLAVNPEANNRVKITPSEGDKQSDDDFLMSSLANNSGK